MNNDFLSRLYWACSDTEMHLENGLNLGEMYERTNGAAIAYNQFSTVVNELSISNVEKDMLGSLRYDACVAYEQQGFINGFRLGIKLAMEIGGEKLASKPMPPHGKHG